ncbi:50S ribosomal protein L24 [Luoshenia tenuis]|uniref:50S ribosomal protein L24 n=1 Tax=Luoshenia tenuis TaxID=2763654 RepID=UPI003D8A891C
MSKLHIKAKDKVMVISGVDAGKIGTIKVAYPSTGRVVVEGLDKSNAMTMATKHIKPRQQGQPGGRIQIDRTIDASNVMLYCSKCAAPRRAKHKVQEDGTKVRVCSKCGETFGK